MDIGRRPRDGSNFVLEVLSLILVAMNIIVKKLLAPVQTHAGNVLQLL